MHYTEAFPVGVICGIYAITNTANGKRYYGSSLNVWRRKHQHWHSLRQGAHRNRHLQAAWKLYGEQAFVFSVIEEAPPDGLLAVEQHYLEQNVGGYNVSMCAECPTRGLKWSLEARARHSEMMRGRTFTTSHRLALSMAGKRRKMTDAQRNAVRKRMMGNVLSGSARSKISARMRSHWDAPEYREKVLAAQNAGKKTERAKINYSTAISTRWATPEQRAKLSAERKARWDNLEYRTKMLEKRRAQGLKLRERNQTKKEKQNALP